jgi:hypothetical protein
MMPVPPESRIAAHKALLRERKNISIAPGTATAAAAPGPAIEAADVTMRNSVSTGETRVSGVIFRKAAEIKATIIPPDAPVTPHTPILRPNATANPVLYTVLINSSFFEVIMPFLLSEYGLFYNNKKKLTREFLKLWNS